MVNREVTGWVGWSFFAGILMVIMGVFQSVAGLTALLNESFYEVTNDGLVVFDFATWGWLHLLIGGLVLVAGTAVISGALWGRMLGVLLAVVGVIANFVFVTAYPVWAVIMMIAYVLIVYSLVVRED